MHRKYFNTIVVIAAICALLTLFHLWKEAFKPAPDVHLVISQPASPFKSYISGVGIVEASSENIFIGTVINRVVEKVLVHVNEKVKKGDVLFCLEARDLKAELLNQQIAYKNAMAKLQKLESLPRPEDIQYAQAVLNSSKIAFVEAETQYQAVAGLCNGALSKEEINRRRFALAQAEAKVQQAEAEFEKTKRGAWLPDLEIAKLEAQQAEANVQRVEADLAQTVVKAPIDGTILQVKIHEGEFPPSDPSRTPAIIMGNTDPLHLRVSINQFDVSDFNPDAPAVAFLQGNAQQWFPLKFVYIEPYFVTKQNLTNDITEKVDTRVLQVVYCFTEKDQRIFVGQQMDVFIETTSNPSKP